MDLGVDAVLDGALPDGGLPDGGLPDGGLPDGGLPDGGLPDGGLPDGGLPDGGLPDLGAIPDSSVGDAAGRVDSSGEAGSDAGDGDAADGCASEVELCDGLDNDCDGEIDEGFGVGAPCRVGVGACRVLGALACVGLQAVACDAAEGAPVAERCNGVDDDCDGEIDEDFPALGASCQVCGARGAMICGADGATTCGAVAQPPADEICDGLDNDCDDLIDEGFSLGGVCTVGRGACTRRGVMACDPGDSSSVRCDVEPGDPAAADATCDGVDDDCDGEIDEDAGEGCLHCAGETLPPCNGCPRGTAVPVGYVCVPRGAFSMGSSPLEAGRGGDEARHWVSLTRPFLMKATEVTQAEWMGLMGSNPSWFQEAGGQCAVDRPCGSRPVERVSWYDALAYLNALSVRDGLTPCYNLDSCDPAGDLGAGCARDLERCLGAYVCDEALLGGAPECRGFRLPAEAEWEYAARAGTQGPIYSEEAFAIDGNCAAAMDPIAWYVCNSGDRTHPAGALAPNAWGLFDMLGNVSELTWDGYREGYETLDLWDPVNPPGALERVNRGGSWSRGAGDVRAARRRSGSAAWRRYLLGFRPARSLACEPRPELCNGLDDDCDGQIDEGCGLVAGEGHTCAILEGGVLKCWGQNQVGQLGLGDRENRGDDPGEMGANLPLVDLGAGRRALAVIAGARYTCALLDRGEVKCWGLDQHGQLGLGQPNRNLVIGDEPGEMGDALAPIDLGAGRTARAITGGALGYVCALLDNGATKCWGYNGSGQLGLGDTAARGDNPGEMGDNLPAVDLGTGRVARSISAGGYDVCALLDNDETKCWGLNRYGAAGLGDAVARGARAGQMGDDLLPVDLGTDRSALSFSKGSDHSCALLDDGHVKCWGRNADGELGLGDRRNRGDGPGEMGDALPVVDLGADHRVVGLSHDGGSNHVCALLDDGSFKCWGRNDFGQLGLGDRANRGGGPGEMGDALPAVDLGRTPTEIALGALHTCARFADGTIKCWGRNDFGQLGLGDTEHRGDDPGEMGLALPAVDLGP